MREILFRGRRLDNREWAFGCYYKQTEFYGDKADGAYIITSGECLSYDQALEYYAVLEETVGQFTGLHDSTKWEDLTDAEKLDFYHEHYIGEDGMSVRFQHIDDVKFLWKGKKIFEGDILHYWSIFHKSYIGKCVVKYGAFNECVYGWYLDNGDIQNLEYSGGIEYEVIGNIHDNPELLETA